MLSRRSHSYGSGSANNHQVNLSDSDMADGDYPGRMQKKKAAVTKKKTVERKSAPKKIKKISRCTNEQQYIASDSSDDKFS